MPLRLAFLLALTSAVAACSPASMPDAGSAGVAPARANPAPGEAVRIEQWPFRGVPLRVSAAFDPMAGPDGTYFYTTVYASRSLQQAVYLSLAQFDGRTIVSPGYVFGGFQVQAICSAYDPVTHWIWTCIGYQNVAGGPFSSIRLRFGLPNASQYEYHNLTWLVAARNALFVYDRPDRQPPAIYAFDKNDGSLLSTTTYPASATIASAVAGPDGNLWYVQSGGRAIATLDAAGSLTTYSLPKRVVATALAPGGDGALWFTIGNAPAIGRITTEGAVSRYALPEVRSRALAIAGDAAATTACKVRPIWFILGLRTSAASGTSPYKPRGYGRISYSCGS